MSDIRKYFGDEGFTPPPDDGKDYSGGPIMPGWYAATITSAVVAEAKSGRGVVLTVEFTLLNGRKVWHRANILHDNTTAQAIGQQELGRLMIACGFGENSRLTDENQLLSKTLDIRVEIEQGKDGRGDQNVVKKFQRVGAESAKHQPTPPARAAGQYAQNSPTTPTAPPPARRPWELKATPPAAPPSDDISGLDSDDPFRKEI